MSETPITDAARKATLIPKYEFEGAEQEAWACSKKVEKMLIEAQKDSARLDRLLDGQHISIDVGPDYTEWPTTREQLDEHLEGW